MGKRQGNTAKSNQWSLLGEQHSCTLNHVVMVLPPEICVVSGQQLFPAGEGGLILASASHVDISCLVLTRGFSCPDAR